MRNQVLAAAVISAVVSPAFADCNMIGGRLFPGAEVNSTMMVSSGKPCGVVLFAGGQSRFDSIGVTARPKHGSLLPRAGVGVTYLSSRGYKGVDEFAFTVTGQMPGGGRGTATVRIRVNVI